MEQADSHNYRYRKESQGEAALSSDAPQVAHPKKRIRWRFKPGSFWKVCTLGLVLFIACRLIVIPFIEGLSNYFVKTHELASLQSRYKVMNKKLVVLKKNREYMQTNAFVEERGHQIGMIKPNESRIVVVDAPESQTSSKPPKKAKAESNNE